MRMGVLLAASLIFSSPLHAQEWLSQSELDEIDARQTLAEMLQETNRQIDERNRARAEELLNEGYVRQPDGSMCLATATGEVCVRLEGHVAGVIGGQDVRDHAWQVELRSTYAYTNYELAKDRKLRTTAEGKLFLNELAPWERVHRCGGTLIATDWVLTAAHCVDPEVNGDVRKTRKVFYGTSDLSAGNGFTGTIDRVVIHQEYNRNNAANDIALVHFRLGDRKRVVRLPTLQQANTIALAGPDSAVPTGRTLTVTGWGKTMPNNPGEKFLAASGKLNHASAVLQGVDLVARPQAECDAVREYRGASGDRTICAAGKVQGTDSCQGDSGGPLTMTVGRDENRRRVLVGVVSQGVGCAYRGIPALYTRVGFYRPWIERAMKTFGGGVFWLP